MNILGIGPFEIVIILVIVLLVLGPDDLQKTGRTIGQWINKVTRSEGWTAVSSISKELRGLPARLAREAQLEELKEQIDIEKQIGGKSIPTTGIDKPTASPGEKKASEKKPESVNPPTSAETPTDKEKTE
jgi:Sec-independent protein translocase protein TatA